jgi:hypothetical protein
VVPPARVRSGTTTASSADLVDLLTAEADARLRAGAAPTGKPQKLLARRCTPSSVANGKTLLVSSASLTQSGVSDSREVRSSRRALEYVRDLQARGLL